MRKLQAIKLSPSEKKLCELLVKVSAKTQPKVTLRAAGGWVRDKLLGIESHDLDIAIDNMTGAEFAQAVHDYVYTELKVPEVLGHQGKVAQIKSNPEKSKHLETARVMLYGNEVDFANLRCEVYEEGSRIPVMKFGTPEEDASRRDLTINSLFYNLHTETVEDFLGSGIEDLQNGIIRTPLPAYETFRDDPLRILRSIRFATRFGYRVVDEIGEAARMPDIKEALKSMVSKERVWEELKKISNGTRPIDAIRYMKNWGIFDCVFELPEYYTGYWDPNADIDRSIELVSALVDVLGDVELTKRLLGVSGESLYILSAEHRRALILAAMMSCYAPLEYQEPKKRRTVSVLQHVTKISLKMPNAESDLVHNLVTNCQNMKLFAKQAVEMDLVSQRKQTRRDIGLFIRHLGQQFGRHYNLAVVFAVADIMVEKQSLENMNRFVEVVHHLKLEHADELSPLVNGTEIIRIRGQLTQSEARPGKWLSEVQEDLIKWQLENGEESEQWLIDNVQVFLNHYLKNLK